MTAGETSVVRQLSSGRAETVAFGRFLDNDGVTTAEIFAAAGVATGKRAAGRRVLAIQDTTALSFPRRNGGGLGPGGDGTVAGIFLHPVLALDAESDVELGLAAGTVWTRAPGKVTPHAERAIEDRESWRWIEQGQAAKTALSEAAHVTLLADRESDIYEQWALLAGPRFDLLTRACRDRRLAGGGMMFAAAKAWESVASYAFDIDARKDRPARRARMALRFGAVAITKPKNCRTENMPATIPLQLVEVEEIDAPRGQEPVHWRLLTTAAVVSVEQAMATVQLYQKRWKIEDYNRACKKSGIDLEGAMVEGVDAARKIWSPSAPYRRSRSCNWSKVATPGRNAAPATCSMRTKKSLPSASVRPSRVRRRNRKTPMKQARSPGSAGLSPASAAGAATPPTAPPAPKPWPTAGKNSKPWRTAGASDEMCESASPLEGGGRAARFFVPITKKLILASAGGRGAPGTTVASTALTPA